MLVIDRNADSLSRSWCGIEIFYTNKCDNSLQLYTSMGRVGTDLTSGPLVEAVKVWDVCRTEASQDTDRRMILNYFCNQPELGGIAVDALTQMPILDESKMKSLDPNLSDVVPQSVAPLRQDGRKEYGHEAALFANHHEKFMSLNRLVRCAQCYAQTEFKSACV